MRLRHSVCQWTQTMGKHLRRQGPHKKRAEATSKARPVHGSGGTDDTWSVRASLSWHNTGRDLPEGLHIVDVVIFGANAQIDCLLQACANGAGDDGQVLCL